MRGAVWGRESRRGRWREEKLPGGSTGENAVVDGARACSLSAAAPASTHGSRDTGQGVEHVVDGVNVSSLAAATPRCARTWRTPSLSCSTSKMMKSGCDGAKAVVHVLWAVCHKYKDRRGRGRADETSSFAAERVCAKVGALAPGRSPSRTAPPATASSPVAAHLDLCPPRTAPQPQRRDSACVELQARAHALSGLSQGCRHGSSARASTDSRLAFAP